MLQARQKLGDLALVGDSGSVRDLAVARAGIVCDRDSSSRIRLDALQRVVRASNELAIRAVTVDALDERASSFYRSFG
jgi:hypothetical protein